MLYVAAAVDLVIADLAPWLETQNLVASEGYGFSMLREDVVATELTL